MDESREVKAASDASDASDVAEPQQDTEAFSAIVPDEIQEVIERIDPADASKLRHFIAVQVQEVHHRGPMPSPSDLAAYQQVQPDLPDRMMKMAEKSLADRSAQQDKILELKEKEIALRNRELTAGENAHIRESGQLSTRLKMSYSLVIFCLIAAVYLELAGHSAFAYLLGGSTIAIVLGAFLKTGKQAKGRSQKDSVTEE